MHFVLEYCSEGQLSCKLLMVGLHENGTQFHPFLSVSGAKHICTLSHYTTI